MVIKRFVLFFFFFIFTLSSVAQTSDLDELTLPVLKGRLMRSKNDTLKVDIQLALGHLILFKSGGGNKEIDSALGFSFQAGKLSKQLKYNFGIINALLLSAESYNQKLEPDMGFRIAHQALGFAKRVNSADGIARSYLIIRQHFPYNTPEGLKMRIFYNDKAIAIFKKERSYTWLANTLTNNAELMFLSGDRTRAIKLLFETLSLGNAVSRRTVEGIYWLIGRTSTELSDYPNAIKYNLLAIKTAHQVADTSLLLCSVNHTMALTYVQMQAFQQALPYSLRALEIATRYKNRAYISPVAVLLADEYARLNMNAKAMELLHEMENDAENDLDRLNVYVSFLNNLTYTGQFRKAGVYALKVQTLLGKIKPHNFTEMMNGYNHLAIYYFATGQNERAALYTKLYSAIARAKNIPAAIRTSENFYFKLDSISGDFKSAVEHHLAAQYIKDSVENVTKSYQVALLQIENNTEQKNLEIDTLTRESLDKDAKLKRNALIQKMVIAVSILLVIITGLIYSRYRLKQRTNKTLENNQKELDQKNLYLEKLNMQQNLLIKEKEWLIKEVHHRVKNNLQMVTSLLYSQSVYLEDASAVLAIKDSLRRMHAMSLIHQKLYQDENTTTISMPEYIDDLVRYLHESFDAENQIIFEQRIHQISLDIAQAIPLGLILTESVVNAIKYAFLNDRAGTVNIELSFESPGMLLLKISDNGIGLPPGFNTSSRTTLGLDLMQGLARQLKGSFSIENHDGVHISVRFAV